MKSCECTSQSYNVEAHLVGPLPSAPSCVGALCNSCQSPRRRAVSRRSKTRPFDNGTLRRRNEIEEDTVGETRTHALPRSIVEPCAALYPVGGCCRNHHRVDRCSRRGTIDEPLKVRSFSSLETSSGKSTRRHRTNLPVTPILTGPPEAGGFVLGVVEVCHNLGFIECGRPPCVSSGSFTLGWRLCSRRRR